MGTDQQQSSAEVEAKNSRFPSGTVRIVTEIPRIAEKLHKISTDAGILLEGAEDGVVIRVDDAGEDSACLVLGSSLPPDEQDAVFLLLDHAPHLRSLRSVLGKCQYAWLFDLIKDGRWESDYQPVFDIQTGTVFGREALLRARMNDGTLVSPTSVFEAARVTRWLPLVDELARNAALRGGASAFPNEEKILINLDAESAREGHFDVSAASAILKEAGRAPESVIFELVESESLGNSVLVAELRAELGNAGFMVALDDLTSGFSTLAVLDQLRPEVVKLDQRLIGGAWNDRYRSRLVRAFVDLCKDLGILLIAEGIEDPDDLTFVRESDVRYVQGYLLGRPAPPPVKPNRAHDAGTGRTQS